MRQSGRPFTDSLSYTLAKNSVLVTLLVGFLLSCIQIAVDFVREQNEIQQFASEILAANQFAAADASFHLDAPAAEEVAKGILQYHSITSVTITNERDEVLTQLASENTERTNFTKGFEIFGEIKGFNQPFYTGYFVWISAKYSFGFYPCLFVLSNHNKKSYCYRRSAQ
jgi:hypothetical protein